MYEFTPAEEPVALCHVLLTEGWSYTFHPEDSPRVN